MSPLLLLVGVEVARDIRPRKKLIDAFRAGKGSVDLESDLGHEFQAQAPGKLAPQEAVVLVETLDCILGAFAAQGQHEDGGELQIRRHAHFWHGERILVEHLVDDLAAGEDLGERVPDGLADFQLALRGCSTLALSLVAMNHGIGLVRRCPGYGTQSVRRTCSTSKHSMTSP